MNARIATYLKVLGIVQLLGLNLGGFFWLAWANGIRDRKPSSRSWVIGVHSVYLAACAAALIMWFLDFNGANHLRFYGNPIEAGRLGVLALILAAGVVYGLPVLWLLSPKVKQQFIESGLGE